MSAKFLHAFADENPDLSRQIGCMTGIFQVFDRQYLLTSGRRLPAPPKRLPSGPTLSNSSSVSADRVSSSPQIILEKNLSKSWKETKQRVSLEPSTSFSSSSSSFSSLDCSRSTNHELPPPDRILFPEMPLKNSPKLKIPDSDIRDVVKDSINRTKEGKEHQFYLKKEGINEMDESFRVLSNLKEVSRNSIMESNQTPRLSFDSRDPFSRSLTRDGPRFSYDGREINSSRSRENYNSYNNNNNNSTNNNNPRLSLDSKEASLWDSDLDSGSSSSLNLNSKNGEKIGIVAKLMGLDTMPKLEINAIESNKDNKFSKEKTLTSEKIVVPKAIKTMQDNNRRIRNPDLGMKPMLSSRIPIEPAPWKSQERVSRISVSPKTNSRIHDVNTNNRTEQHFSVYSEIEKRLKDLEFEHSNRDLRALKQILDSMQAKGLLETKKDEPNPNSNLNPNFSQMKQSFRKNGVRNEFKSPIVIMKPSKSSLGMAETVPVQVTVPVLPQVRTNEAIITKKPPFNSRISKEQAGKASPRVSPNRRTEYRKTEEGFKQKSNSNSNVNLNSNATSPRLEKRTKPPIPNSDSNKTQRNKNSSDLISPRNRTRRKPTQTEKHDEVPSDVSMGRNGDDMSIRSDSNISMMSSKVEIEVTSTDTSHISLPLKGSKRDNRQVDYSNVELNGSDPLPVTPEHPSPVSVLDNSFYHDDVSPPKSKSSNINRDVKSQASEKKSPSPKSKKRENIESLLQKLDQLTLTNETDKTGPIITDHISLLCETANPDDRYVSEILLASGLLMKDLLEIQLHGSGYPIDPDLFLVLEQRKMGWVSKPETRLKFDPERTKRKLVFDLVNEILLRKMDLKSGVIKRGSSGQRLLREICGEIKELKRREKEEERDHESEILSGKDLVTRSDEWVQFGREVSGLVLDIERGIFKELIDDVINGERVNNNNNNNNKGKGRRRQLFVK